MPVYKSKLTTERGNEKLVEVGWGDGNDKRNQESSLFQKWKKGEKQGVGWGLKHSSLEVKSEWRHRSGAFRGMKNGIRGDRIQIVSAFQLSFVPFLFSLSLSIFLFLRFLSRFKFDFSVSCRSLFLWRTDRAHYLTPKRRKLLWFLSWSSGRLVTCQLKSLRLS